MVGLGRVWRVGGRGGRLSGPLRRGGLVGAGRVRACGGVGAFATRLLQGLTSALSLVSNAPGALGDVFELLGVRLKAVGAAAPVNQLLRLALQALEIHGTSLVRACRRAL